MSISRALRLVPATGKVVSVEAVSMRLTDSPDWTVVPTPLTVVGSLVVDGGILDVTVQFRVPTALPGGDQMIEQMLASVDIKGA